MYNYKKKTMLLYYLIIVTGNRYSSPNQVTKQKLQEYILFALFYLY